MVNTTFGVADYAAKLFSMSVTDLIASIDSEIVRLQQARTLLAGSDGQTPRTGRKGKRRTMSAEARARIAAAQRKRWAAQKRAAK